MDLPIFLARRRNVWTARRSYLWQLVRGIPAAIVFTGNDPHGTRTITVLGEENGFLVVDPGRRVRGYLKDGKLPPTVLSVSELHEALAAAGASRGR